MTNKSCINVEFDDELVKTIESKTNISGYKLMNEEEQAKVIDRYVDILRKEYGVNTEAFND